VKTNLKISLAMVVASAAAACNLILGGGYELSDFGPGGGGNPADTGASPDGTRPGDDAACPENPQTVAELQRACTNAACRPFSNDRLVGCTKAGDRFTCPDPPPNDGGGGGPGGGQDAGGLIACSAVAGSPSATPGKSFPADTVYIVGGDAMLPFASRVAQAAADQGRATVIYSQGISCANIKALVNGEKLKTAISSVGFYYEPTAGADNLPVRRLCAMGDDTVADVSISNAFATTCLTLPQGLPSSFRDVLGPVLVVAFGVPKVSTQTSISAEAAKLVFGVGGAGAVPPWTDPTAVHIRGPQAGVVVTPAPIIGVPVDRWKGNVQANAMTLYNAMIAANTAGGETAEKTIGILASSDLDPRRDRLKPLAFQDVGQSCGYYPDSTEQAFDKANVRDGHYPIWSSTHFTLRVNAQGLPINARAGEVVDIMQGAATLSGLDIIQLYALGRVIPNCAMKVRKTSESEYTPFRPQNACGCYFDVQATGTTACKPCSSNADCADAPNGATQCNRFGTPAVGHCELPGQE